MTTSTVQCRKFLLTCITFLIHLGNFLIFVNKNLKPVPVTNSHDKKSQFTSVVLTFD